MARTSQIEPPAAAEQDEAVKGNGAFAMALLDPDLDIPDGVTDPQGKPAPKRYAVYRNNVVVSLMEALRSAYPAVAEIAGAENFDRIARNYVLADPPSSAMMQTYGKGFAAFLDRFPPLRNSPFLGDVARAERAWLEAYHAVDAPALGPGDVEGLGEAAVMELCLVRHPSAALIASRWPVFDLFGWRDGRPQAGADLQKAQSIAVCRPALEVHVHELTPGLYGFVEALFAGKTLGQAAGETLAVHDDFDLSAGLAFVLTSGLFAQPRDSN